MALNFYTQGVDISGLGQGIARGIEQLGEAKRREDERIRKELDDFESKYELGKIIPSDVPELVTNFDEMKKNGLIYKKLDKSGAKPEVISAAKMKFDESIGKINKLYSNSAQKGQIISTYSKYINDLNSKGLETPSEITDTMFGLIKTPTSQTDLKTVPNPFDFEIDANEKDLSGLDSVVSKLKPGITTIPGAEAFEIKVGNDIIKVGEDVNYQQRNPMSVVSVVDTTIEAGKGRLKNTAIKEKTALINGLNIPDNTPDINAQIEKQSAVANYNKIIKALSSQGIKITNPNQLTPGMVIAANRGYFDAVPVSRKLNKSEFDIKLALLSKQKQWSKDDKNLALAYSRFNQNQMSNKISALRFLFTYGGEADPELARQLDLSPEEVSAARKEFLALKPTRGAGFLDY